MARTTETIESNKLTNRHGDMLYFSIVETREEGKLLRTTYSVEDNRPHIDEGRRYRDYKDEKSYRRALARWRKKLTV